MTKTPPARGATIAPEKTEDLRRVGINPDFWHPAALSADVRKGKTAHLEAVARAAAQGKLAIPVARTVSLTQAIDAHIGLERTHTPEGGKLVVVPQ